MKSYVLCVRHPDAPLEFTIDGSVTVVSLDLGSGFDTRPRALDDALEFTDASLGKIESLPARSALWGRALEVLTDTVGEFQEALDRIRAYENRIHAAPSMDADQLSLAAALKLRSQAEDQVVRVSLLKALELTKRVWPSARYLRASPSEDDLYNSLSFPDAVVDSKFEHVEGAPDDEIAWDEQMLQYLGNLEDGNRDHWAFARVKHDGREWLDLDAVESHYAR